MVQEGRAKVGWEEKGDERRCSCCRCRRCSSCASGVLQFGPSWFSLTLWRDWLQGDGNGQLVSLVAAAVFLIAAGMVVWSSIGGDENADESFEQSLWMSWGLFFDPGTQTGVKADAPTKVKATALVFSVLGFLYNLTFLGIIVEWIRSSMDHWSRTKSRVWHGGHVLVLGWSEKTLYLLNELFEKLLNSDKTPHVVLLADRDEAEMRQEVKQHFYQLWEGLSFFDRRWKMLKALKLRGGLAHDSDALERASASRAQEIIILSRDGNPRSADLETVRVMVALSSLRRPVRCRIFAEAQAQEVEIVLRRLHRSPESCQVIHAREACNHILALLGADQMVGGCVADLCSYAAGDELYVIGRQAGWRCFGDARLAFDNAVCIGVEARGGDERVLLAPRDDRSFLPGERLVVMASSFQDVQMYEGSLFHWRNARPAFMSSISLLTDLTGSGGASGACESLEARQPLQQETGTKTYVVIGWPADLGHILTLLDQNVAAGTEVHVLSERTEEQRKLLGVGQLENLVLTHYYGARTSREEIQKLEEPLKRAVNTGAVLILAQLAAQAQGNEEVPDDDEVGDDTLTCDAACLTSLLVVADLLGAKKLTGRRTQAFDLAKGATSSLAAMSQKQTNVICEVLDPRTEQVVSRNQELQKLAFFFRSKALETGIFMMAMSEPTVHEALLKLMSPAHPSLQAKPVWSFWDFPKEEGEGSFLGKRSWNELGDAVRRQNGLLVGWKRRNEVCRLTPSAGKDRPEKWFSHDTLMVILPPNMS